MVGMLHGTGPNPKITTEAYIRIPIRLFSFGSNKIHQDQIEQLKSAVEAMSLTARLFAVDALKLSATSALRSAENSAEIIEYIFQQTGQKIGLLSGLAEAQLIIDAILLERQAELSGNNLHFDLGGGSTEIICYNRSKLLSLNSFEIGSLRYKNGNYDNQTLEGLKQWLEKQEKDYSPRLATGSGGAFGVIAQVLEMLLGVPNCKIDLKNISHAKAELAKAGVKEISASYGLALDRAELCLPALELTEILLQSSGSSEIINSNFGLCHGIILNAWRDGQC